MITFVEGDDWRGIYIDGELFIEGHSWHVSDTAAAINRAMGSTKRYLQAGVIYADLDWLSEQGRLPRSLDDVVSA